MGTDTMAYAASALSFMLENLGKTVRTDVELQPDPRAVEAFLCHSVGVLSSVGCAVWCLCVLLARVQTHYRLTECCSLFVEASTIVLWVICCSCCGCQRR